jgi:hypothetical protein
MNEPMELQARQLALNALTTEHSNLQMARMGTIAEANGRSTLSPQRLAGLGRQELPEPGLRSRRKLARLGGFT